MSLYLSLLILNFVIGSCISELSPVVQTSSGPIQGQLINVTPSTQVYQFLGIPYAEPPIGDLRFKKTVPKKAWDEVLIADSQPKACPQVPNSPGGDISTENSTSEQSKTSFDMIKESDEDCLYLNIWVPKSTLDNAANAKAAPFTFIHGGGFLTGAISERPYNGSIFSGFNHIVFASMQYRLGHLGFAYQGNDDAPGNMGLWDQNEALKWLCVNFKAFGADCGLHTIGGESAGAVSVGLHLLSPMSQPFFKKAILQSGSGLVTGFAVPKEQAKASTDALISGMAFGMCNGSNDGIGCIKELPANLFPIEGFRIRGGNVPVIDGEFLPKHPLEMLREGNFAKYPIIVGANENEGSFFFKVNRRISDVLPGIADASITFDKLAKDVTFETFEQLLNISFSRFSDEPLLLDAIKYHYWPEGDEGFPGGKAALNSAIAAAGDSMITCPTYKWADFTANVTELSGKVWAYYYTHKAAHHIFGRPWMGVTHMSEIPIIFGEPYASYAKDFGYSSDDRRFSQVIRRYFANFIQNGDPNVRNGVFGNTRATQRLLHRQWPTYIGGGCKGRVADMNTMAQVYSYGRSYTCGTKVRDCSFWHDFFLRLAEQLL